jgi:hypothetical protein
MALNGKSVQIDSILERVLRDYGLQDIYPDEAAEWIWDIVAFIGTPYVMEDAEPVKIEIVNYRGILPYDLYSVEQVREYTTGIPMREMSDLFFGSQNSIFNEGTELEQDADPTTGETFTTAVGPTTDPDYFTFKIQNNYIFTGIDNGDVEMAYKKFPVDENTLLPLIPENAKYIRAVVSYIAERKAFKLMLQDLLSERKYDRIEQKYLFDVGAAQSECILPDKTRMENLINRMKSPYPYHDHFDVNFRHLGSRNY